jgi:hypothetical protein
MSRHLGVVVSLALAACLAASAAEAGGKVVVTHDEWPLSDHGFLAAAPSARQLALNLAKFFTGTRRGTFLVYSPNFGLNGHSLASTMRTAGHTWTMLDPAGPPVDLSPYDAVFVGETVMNAQMLKAYVLGGGSVYVMAGTGFGVADDAWNEFLHAFGLHLATHYNTVVGVTPTSSKHEIFKGVSELLYDTGNSVRALVTPGAQVIEQTHGEGLFAVATESLLTVDVAICGQRPALKRGGRGTFHVSIAGTRDVPGTAIDPASIRLVGVRPSEIMLYDTRPGSPHASKECRRHSDGVADLLLTFDARQVAEAVWGQIVPPVTNGETILLMLTGKLRPDLGATFFYGEAELELKTK